MQLAPQLGSASTSSCPEFGHSWAQGRSWHTRRPLTGLREGRALRGGPKEPCKEQACSQHHSKTRGLILASPSEHRAPIPCALRGCAQPPAGFTGPRHRTSLPALQVHLSAHFLLSFLSAVPLRGGSSGVRCASNSGFKATIRGGRKSWLPRGREHSCSFSQKLQHVKRKGGDAKGRASQAHVKSSSSCCGFRSCLQ